LRIAEHQIPATKSIDPTNFVDRDISATKAPCWYLYAGAFGQIQGHASMCANTLVWPLRISSATMTTICGAEQKCPSEKTTHLDLAMKWSSAINAALDQFSL
jgi:hypothetical protein